MTTDSDVLQAQGPKAPRDPEKKRRGFYIMRHKEIAGSPQPDKRGVQFLYLDGERLTTCADLVGKVRDPELLRLLQTAAGFRKLVHSIGISAQITEGKSRAVDFIFQMYGKKDPFVSGTQIRLTIPTDGMERITKLSDWDWSEDDNVPGQIRFEFPAAGELACVSVKLYLHDGYDAPEEEEEAAVDLSSALYTKMLGASLLQIGNTGRLKRAIEKARNGEEVTIAFIGGSITQGAGAIPIHTGCYAYKTFQGLCALAGKGTEENIHYRKAGVGGTPSELGMLRYETDVLRGDSTKPDIVVVEFAVNDAGDETNGECFDSLVRKILKAENHPAVVLLFAVFANDWNLQERLSVVGKAYGLPMVSIRDAVVAQFYKKTGEGRVFDKGQFFYDCYHPTNLGHTVMADCITHLFRVVDELPMREDALEFCEAPPLGGEFEDVKLFDRSCAVGELFGKCESLDDASGEICVDCGSFCYRDEDLQGVEMDRDLTQTKEFPHNWMHRGTDTERSKFDCPGAQADSGWQNEPFRMEITCSALLLVYKDSGDITFGRAEVWVDGEKVLTADPHLNGWTHCNALICFRGRKRRRYHVEVRMVPGEENKNFTILGFGYVS